MQCWASFQVIRMQALGNLPPWNVAKSNCGEKILLQTISNVNTIQNCMLSTLGLGADIDIQLYINSSDNVQSYPQIFLCHCAEGQDVHYVPLQKNSKITLTSHQSPWQITRLGGTYQMSYGKLSLRWLSSLLSMNGHITFAVKLILCITHVIVLQHWLRFIFKVFHKFILAFPMFSWRKRKAKSLLVF